MKENVYKPLKDGGEGRLRVPNVYGIEEYPRLR